MYLLISYKIAKLINIKMAEKKIILILKDISNKQIATKIKKELRSGFLEKHLKNTFLKKFYGDKKNNFLMELVILGSIV